MSFLKHIREDIIKAMKGIALLKFISKYVSRNVLNMTYKLYTRPHLDYSDVIFHNQRVDMMNLIEQVQYKAALIVTGCWQGTSRDKLYDELGWELFSDRWFRRLTLFYKISNGYTPSYLSDHIPNRKETHYNLRRKVELETPIIRTSRYENSFFPYCIREWNTPDDELKSLQTLQSFKKHLDTFIRPNERCFYGITDNVGIKLLTKIRVEFSLI